MHGNFHLKQAASLRDLWTGRRGGGGGLAQNLNTFLTLCLVLICSQVYEVLNIRSLKQATPNLRVINLWGVRCCEISSSSSHHLISPIQPYYPQVWPFQSPVLWTMAMSRLSARIASSWPSCRSTSAQKCKAAVSRFYYKGDQSIQQCLCKYTCTCTFQYLPSYLHLLPILAYLFLYMYLHLYLLPIHRCKHLTCLMLQQTGLVGEHVSKQSSKENQKRKAN